MTEWLIAATVYDAAPRLLPNTVTLADPVDAAFDFNNTLSIATSIDTASLKLPTAMPVVNDSLLVENTAATTLHRTEESASHSVASHAVSPNAFAGV